MNTHAVSLLTKCGVAAATSVMLTKSQMRIHSKMCIDHKNGFSLKNTRTTECYPGPGAIMSQRKYKRRCLGIHPLPVFFSRWMWSLYWLTHLCNAMICPFLYRHVEIPKGLPFSINLKMAYEGDARAWPVETVWGGGGECEMPGEDGTKFYFNSVDDNETRSFISSGQLPLLYYIWYCGYNLLRVSGNAE